MSYQGTRVGILCFTAQQNPTIVNTYRLLLSLVEICKIFPGDIFGVNDSQLKWPRNLLIYDLLPPKVPPQTR